MSRSVVSAILPRRERQHRARIPLMCRRAFIGASNVHLLTPAWCCWDLGGHHSTSCAGAFESATVSQQWLIAHRASTSSDQQHLFCASPRHRERKAFPAASLPPRTSACRARVSNRTTCPGGRRVLSPRLPATTSRWGCRPSRSSRSFTAVSLTRTTPFSESSRRPRRGCEAHLNTCRG